jgi:hypothetical protein
MPLTCSAESLAALYVTLASHGISAAQVTSHGDSVDVETTVKQAASFFSTAFYTFQHSKTGRLSVRQWGECSLSPAIADQVVLVLGVSTFPTTEQRWQRAQRRREARQRRADASPAADEPLWVPQAVGAMYHLPFPIAPLSTPYVSAGVIEWEEESFSPSDLGNFSLNTSIPLAPVDAHHIYGNNSIAEPGVEASLDIQWLEGIAPGATPWFWLVNNDTAWMYPNIPTALISPLLLLLCASNRLHLLCLSSGTLSPYNFSPPPTTRPSSRCRTECRRWTTATSSSRRTATASITPPTSTSARLPLRLSASAPPITSASYPLLLCPLSPHGLQIVDKQFMKMGLIGSGRLAAHCITPRCAAGTTVMLTGRTALSLPSSRCPQCEHLRRIR